jgi:hypothetical protein
MMRTRVLHVAIVAVANPPCGTIAIANAIAIAAPSWCIVRIMMAMALLFFGGMGNKYQSRVVIHTL